MDNHDYSNIFPMIEGEDFMQLVVSIRDHGLDHPIVIFDGKILDGRNRFAACGTQSMIYVSMVHLQIMTTGEIRDECFRNRSNGYSKP